MRQHLDVVGWLNLVMGLVGVAVALLVFGLLGGVGVLADDAQAGATVALIGGFIATIIALLSAPSLVGGWGLLKRRPWARVLVLIVSGLNLFAFPMGTLIGGYSLWVLLNDETRAILERGEEPLTR